jgi:tetratricopeptide (TPR) repeat protein
VKSTLLTTIAVGLPLIAMMAFWHHISTAPPPVPAPVVKPVAAPQGIALREFPAAGEHPASRPAPSDPALADTFEEWLNHLQESVQGDPTQQAAAADLLKLRKAADTVQAIDRLLVRNPNDPLLMTGKAMALTAAGRHDDALPLLENLARRQPTGVLAQFNYAVALMRASEQSAAVAAFRRVLALQPGHPRATFNLAGLLQSMNQPAAALTLWRQLTETAGSAATHSAAATVPESPMTASRLSAAVLADAWSHRGELALELKQPAEAEKCFAQAAQIEPRNAAAWCNVGIARAEQSRRTDSLKALTIALEIDPALVPAINQTAYLQAANYRDTGDPAYGRIVVDCCRQSLRLNPAQPNIMALERAAREFDPTVSK